MSGICSRHQHREQGCELCSAMDGVLYGAGRVVQSAGRVAPPFEPPPMESSVAPCRVEPCREAVPFSTELHVNGRWCSGCDEEAVGVVVHAANGVSFWVQLPGGTAIVDGPATTIGAAMNEVERLRGIRR